MNHERARNRRRRGVTLIELIVALSISTFALAAIIGSFLFIARSSLLSQAYSGMDTEARIGLEIFGRDARMAIQVNGSTLATDRVSFLVPTSRTATATVTYEYDAATKIFYRNRGMADERELIRGVDVFVLNYYTIVEDPSTGLPEAASVPSEAKQVQIQLRALREGVSRATATNNVISARYVLRNNFQG